MAKGTVDTSGTISPELAPLFTASVSKLLGLQDTTPVTDYTGRNVQRTAPLSQNEREGIGLARGLEKPSGLKALALRDILRMPQLAAAGPGTGKATDEGLPDIRTFLDILANPAPPLPADKSNTAAPFGPNPRPVKPPVEISYTGPPGEGGPRPGGGGDPGGGGGGGGGIPLSGRDALPAAAGATSSSGDLRGKTLPNRDGTFTRYDAQGRSTILDKNGVPQTPEGARGSIGPNHTPSVFRNGQWVTDGNDPQGYLDALDPNRGTNPGGGASPQTTPPTPAPPTDRTGAIPPVREGGGRQIRPRGQPSNGLPNMPLRDALGIGPRGGSPANMSVESPTEVRAPQAAAPPAKPWLSGGGPAGGPVGGPTPMPPAAAPQALPPWLAGGGPAGGPVGDPTPVQPGAKPWLSGGGPAGGPMAGPAPMQPGRMISGGGPSGGPTGMPTRVVPPRDGGPVTPPGGAGVLGADPPGGSGSDPYSDPDGWGYWNAHDFQGGPSDPNLPPRVPPVLPPPRPPGGPPVVPPRTDYGGPPSNTTDPRGRGEDMPPPAGASIPALKALEGISGRETAPDNDYAFLDQSPNIKAAMEAFQRRALPTIQNQTTLAGLGRSTAASNAIADAQGQMMVPLIQDELSRQERSSVRRSEATERGIQNLLQLAGGEEARQSGAVSTLMGTGAVDRGIGQSAEDAAYADFLRRQGLSEQAQFVPFGATVPSAFGSKQISSGGLFK